MKRIAWILLPLFLAACSASADEDEEQGNAPAATATVETAAAAVRPVDETLVAYGSISSGPLLSLAAAPDTAAAYARAKAEADFARTALARTRALFQEKLANNIQLADAERADAEAAANLAAQERLSGGTAETAVRAPDDRIAASGANIRYVLLGVNPEDAAQLKPGMTVRITAAFDAGLSAETHLQQVGRQVDETTGLVDLSAPLSGKEAARFIPGTAVNAVIVLQEANGVAVPRSAVLKDNDGAYVFTVTDSKAHRVNVTAGADDGAYVAIPKGLKAGEKVVTLGNYELEDGMAVKEPKT